VRAKLTKRVVDPLTARSTAYECRDTEIKGFLLRVQPSGRRAWFYQYRRADGRQTRLRLGTYPGLSPGSARNVALVRATEAARGIDLVARKRAEREEGIRSRHRTLGAFLKDRYEPWAKIHLKTASSQLERLRSDFSGWLERPMHELNTFAVEGLRQKWKRDGAKPATINRDIQRLHSVLSRAVAMGVLEKHPFQGLKPLKHDKSGRVRFLSAEEEMALRAALSAREENLKAARIRFNTWRVARHLNPLPERDGELLDHLKPMVLVALNTGLRRGELLGLKWADVNLPAELLTVTAASAKSGQSRRVPLNPEALPILVAWKQRSGKSDGLVFPGAGGNRMGNINRSWRGVVTSAGLRDFRFHDLRHTFASKLVQAGVDLNTVRELLGHRDIAMTLRYGHLSPDNLRAAVSKMCAS
jgi:integrase